MEKIIKTGKRLFFELLNEIMWLVKYLLFDRGVQKRAGPKIMMGYFTLQVVLFYLFHTLHLPAFKISWLYPMRDGTEADTHPKLVDFL